MVENFTCICDWKSEAVESHNVIKLHISQERLQVKG